MTELDGKSLSSDDIQALFPGEWWLEVFDQMADGTPVVFVEGSVSVDSYAAGAGPWAIVIHGDLHATGDLDFSTSDYKTSLLVVRGSVRARNFQFTNGATCAISEDLVCSELVIGRYGDESARLEVGGTLRARALLLDHVTGVSARVLDALVCSSRGWGLPMDIEYEASHEDIFESSVIDADHRLVMWAAWEAATSGKPIFLRGAENRLRARRKT